jgi:flagellar basal body P-ring protein FlgI
MDSGELESLTGAAMLRTSLINTDGTDNRLLAVCEGSRLTLFVNGEQAAQVKDSALTRGDVGMAAGAVDQGGTIVWFDNFDVREP